jgi:molybdopterin synthase sulfur carrier subunit
MTSILYFAWLRERVGVAEESVAIPGEVVTVTELMGWLAGRSAGHAAAFERPELVRCAIDQEFVGAEAAVAPAREIAFFPPVTGG